MRRLFRDVHVCRDLRCRCAFLTTSSLFQGHCLNGAECKYAHGKADIRKDEPEKKPVVVKPVVPLDLLPTDGPSAWDQLEHTRAAKEAKQERAGWAKSDAAGADAGARLGRELKINGVGNCAEHAGWISVAG